MLLGLRVHLFVWQLCRPAAAARTLASIVTFGANPAVVQEQLENSEARRVGSADLQINHFTFVIVPPLLAANHLDNIYSPFINVIPAAVLGACIALRSK